MKRLKWYVVNLLVAIDQLANAVLGGWCDESLSSHSYRLWRDDKPWGWLMHVIDLLFFWQRQPPHVYGHCHGAFVKEQARYQLPPEMR